MFDLWRSGFIRRPLADVVDRPPRPDEIVWLPDVGPYAYLADPFAIQRDGGLTVFVEAFDYHLRRGRIRFYRYDADDRLVDQGLALSEPWHLSYPTLIQDGDALYMLPEGYKSGGLILYRCVRFPDQWQDVARLGEAAAIDPTVVRHDGRWWLFYALAGPDDRAMRELHVAWAETLTGPWTPHPGNPVMRGLDVSRPGGTAFVQDGAVHLPVQDCAAAYGVAINLLRIDALSPRTFAASTVRRFEPGDLSPGFSDGLHTLSGLGGVTCIDVKAERRSAVEPWLKASFKLRRLLGVNGPRGRRATGAVAYPEMFTASPGRKED
jgi:hypothetical protein